jgi:choline dehydrogenase-like flavoprotein
MATATTGAHTFDENVGIRFREILSGYVRGGGQPLRGARDAGRFSFDVVLEIPRLRDFLAADRHVARITGGTVEWKPFVPRTEVRPGEVVLFRRAGGNRRRKFYDFRFAFPSGHGYDILFEGTKILKSDAPFDAAVDMTTIFATLFAGGQPIAKGVLNVHIDELLRQLDSMEAIDASNAAEASAARDAFFAFFNHEAREVYPEIPLLLRDDRRLSDEERRALRICLPIVLPHPMPAGGPTVEDVIANLERFVGLANPRQLADIRNTLRAAAIALPLLDDLLDLRRIAAAELRRKARSPLYDVLEQLHTLAVFPFYSHPKTDALVGYRRPAHVRRPPTPSLPVAAEPPDRVYDVVIAGTGPAGSLLADRLTAQGKAVLMLEEGAYVPERDIDADELTWTARLYKRSALQRANEPRSILAPQIPGFIVLQGGCVGGGSVVNNAVCFRLEPRRLRDWQSNGFPLEGADLDAGYAAAARDLSIGPVSKTARLLNPANRYLEGTLGPVLVPDAGAPTAPGLWECLVNLEPADGPDAGCLGLGLCNVGCGSERKRNALQVHLRNAGTRDLTIVPHARATQLEMNAAGTRVDGVVVTLRDGRRVTVRARDYVLSCGPIGSSEVLLRTPGLQPRIRSGQLPVGQRFSANVGSPLFAFVNEEVNRTPGLQIAHAYVPPDGNAGFVLETWYNPPAGNAAAMPGYMDVHFERMKQFARCVAAAPLVGTRPIGRIGLRDDRVTIDLPIQTPEIDSLAAGVGLLAGAFLAGGAREVVGAVGWGFEMKRAADVGRFRDELHRLARNERHRHLLRFGTGHPQGGNAMSEDPAIGVVGSDFRVRGVDNLRVCDGSIFPDSARVNPQWTILALADRCAAAMSA